MKKFGVVVLGALALSLVGCASKGEEAQVAEPAEEQTADSGNTVGLANPWIDTDKNGVKAATGFELNVPVEAQNVMYSYLEDAQMAQVTYLIGEDEFVYRAQPTAELMDISGFNYDWFLEDDCTVHGFEGKELAYSDAEEDAEFIDDAFYVHVVYWYNTDEGATYSLSTSGKDLNGMDITAIAEGL
ncbi:MAG: hypothetical protein K6E79_03120 [Pseudobutyrivibrio sp.]|nr:hypothetical protein [Pseudobutyrivibrio sp.]